MRPQLLIRKIHKWAGLILGIQILLWFISGFLMSFMPIEEVRGDHLLQPKKPEPINLTVIDLSQIAEQVDSPVHSIEIKHWLGQTVLTVKTTENSRMFYADSLQPVTPLDRSQIKNVLATHLKAGFKVTEIQRLMEAPNEARGRQAPLWQVQLAGSENPRIYISEQSGEIVAKRTDRWRLFDFLWMLHIMDYDERSDFNHPLLYMTALFALLFVVTGFVLLYFTFRKKNRTVPNKF